MVYMSLLFTNVYANTIISKKDVSAAKQMIIKYKTKLYSLPNYQKYSSERPEIKTEKIISYFMNEFKPYVSDSELTDLVTSRTLVLCGQATINSKGTMKLKSLSFNNTMLDNKNQEIVLDYTANCMFKLNDKKYYFKDNSQAIIKKIKGKLIINSDFIYFSKVIMHLAEPTLPLPK